jgi:hypothetical protein
MLGRNDPVMPLTLPLRPALRRTVYAFAALALFLIALGVARDAGRGWWQLGAFLVVPDVALLAGAGSGLARGQLHPRAVPLYNALHRFVGPSLLGIVTLTGALGTAWLVAALAWACHVALDRAVGYDLRTREGFQRA